jgi:hypothetical protein
VVHIRAGREQATARRQSVSKMEEELVVERLPRETCGCGREHGGQHGLALHSHRVKQQRMAARTGQEFDLVRYFDPLG